MGATFRIGNAKTDISIRGPHPRILVFPACVALSHTKISPPKNSVHPDNICNKIGSPSVAVGRRCHASANRRLWLTFCSVPAWLNYEPPLLRRESAAHINSESLYSGLESARQFCWSTFTHHCLLLVTICSGASRICEAKNYAHAYNVGGRGSTHVNSIRVHADSTSILRCACR